MGGDFERERTGWLLKPRRGGEREHGRADGNRGLQGQVYESNTGMKREVAFLGGRGGEGQGRGGGMLGG